MEAGIDTSHLDTEDEDSLMIDSEEDETMDGSDIDADRGPGSTLSDSEFDDLGISMENKNTQRKTDTDIRILITYFRSINEMRSPEMIPAEELDRYLSTFFSIVKKHDGNEYEPASLRGMLCSVERFLKMKHYQSSVTRDLAFANTRHALKLKQQKLRELGKGTKKTSEPFGKVALDKVNQLFSAHEMGPYTPMSVINTLCFMIIVHFRLRKAIDHKNLLWGDIKLGSEQNGQEYLVYESISVTDSNSSVKSSEGKNNQKLYIYAQKEFPDRDPVGIYKLYADKRPPNMQYDNSPFYLGITTLHPSPLQAWYRTCAMGVNKLSDLVRMIRDMTGLPRATLHGSAESVLAESYSTTSKKTLHAQFARHNTSFPITNFTPILPKPEQIAQLVAGNTSVKRIHLQHPQTAIDSMKHKFYSDGVVQSKEEAHSNDKLYDGMGILENMEKPSRQNTIQKNPDSHQKMSLSCSGSDQTIVSNINSVRGQFLDLVQRLEDHDIKKFDSWLKTIKLQKDLKTGKVHCEEAGGKIDAEVNLTSDSVNKEGQVPDTTTITLNITLSPQALLGEAPPIISAVSNIKGKQHGNNHCEKISWQSSRDLSIGDERKSVTKQESKKCLKREYPDDLDVDSPMASVSKMDKPSDNPVNLTTKSTASNISSDILKPFSKSKVSSSLYLGQNIKTQSKFAKGDNKFLNGNCSAMPIDFSHFGGIWSIPQAHTGRPCLQRLPQRDGRDLGVFIPVSFSYPVPGFDALGSRGIGSEATVNAESKNTQVSVSCASLPYSRGLEKQTNASENAYCMKKEVCVPKVSVIPDQKDETPIN